MTDNTSELSRAQLNALAEAFRLLGEPNRLRIIMYCTSAPKAVGDIAAKLELSQTLVSHHLRLLRGARLLIGKRQSQHVYYSIPDRHVSDMISNMAAHFRETSALNR
ncbi:ArsR/SmtB family transcription factor [Pelagibacterium halotolerans]|uniref:ArsR/SmtB family transcription factor n=1 Tax=Pelagibacterium halotolerans TaxID=531813 RepID=UPI0006810917|nr:metalloregulator ArsR/SmtB family transcription factor [Pelagibacterium halotolerans]QJR17499.1 winged helix-turn-helix transcriptional regulator [Pelagibacterium halotolerans]